MLSGSDDLLIQLRDGSHPIPVNLNRPDPDNPATASTTVADLVAAINAAGGGKFAAELATRGTETIIKLTDHTTGDQVFTIAQADSSLAGFVLGLLGEDDDGDGMLQSGPLQIDTRADHLFLRDTLLRGDVSLTAPDIGASARFGPQGFGVGIDVVGGTLAGILTLEASLKHPNQDGRIELAELNANLAGADLNKIVAADVRGAANLVLPVAVSGDLVDFDFDLADDARVVAQWTYPDTVHVATSGLGNLAQFDTLSFS